MSQRLERTEAVRESGRPGRSAWLFAVLAFLLVTSCATPPPPPVPKAEMDVALDAGGTRMFYTGSAFIPRGFNSENSFELEIDIKAWSPTAVEPASRIAMEALGARHQATGLFQPLAHGEGVISLSAGRLLLRGKVLAEGKELDGLWFIDGKRGGGFRIARKGTIFPSAQRRAGPEG